MRLWPWAVVLMVMAPAGAAEAQVLARVETRASVRIPEFLLLEHGDVEETTRPDGSKVRVVKLYVSANRSWRLDVQRRCGSTCAPVRYQVSRTQGGSAKGAEVVVEFVWPRNEKPPAPDEFGYVLTGV